MAYLRRNRPQKPFDQRVESVKAFGALFDKDVPEGCEASRHKVGVSLKKGRLSPVYIDYKKRPKELGVDFFTGPHKRIV